MVRRLVDEGLVDRDERKRLRFTDHGQEVAAQIVSRHRLIEAFLVEVFGIPWDEVHEEAHTFEHAISRDLEQRMYELLRTRRRALTATRSACGSRAGEALARVPTGSRARVLRVENEDPTCCACSSAPASARRHDHDRAARRRRARAADAARRDPAVARRGDVGVGVGHRARHRRACRRARRGLDCAARETPTGGAEKTRRAADVAARRGIRWS